MNDGDGVLETPEAPVIDMPAPPQGRPSERRSTIGTVLAIFGIAGGFLFMYVVGGFFALRSFLRWRDGKIGRPTFAWISAGWSVLIVAAVILFLAVAVDGRSLITDDFADPDSGFPVASDAAFSAGYVDDAYQMTIGSRVEGRLEHRGVIWNEGPRSAVATEVDVLPLGGWAGVGCLDASRDGGYLFLVGPTNRYNVVRLTANGSETLESGSFTASPATADGQLRLAGECRLEAGAAGLRFSVNNTEIAQVMDADGVVDSFTAVALAVGSLDGETANARFDDLLVRTLN